MVAKGSTGGVGGPRIPLPIISALPPGGSGGAPQAGERISNPRSMALGLHEVKVDMPVPRRHPGQKPRRRPATLRILISDVCVHSLSSIAPELTYHIILGVFLEH